MNLREKINFKKNLNKETSFRLHHSKYITPLLVLSESFDFIKFTSNTMNIR